MQEVWKDIPGYEGEYQVSDLGRVKSLRRCVRCGYKGRGKRRVPEKILRPGRYCSSGHVSVVLRKGTHGLPVHKLVMLAFVGERPDGMDICHNDGNPSNNCLTNLRYDTRTNNILDVYKHSGKWRKLSPDDVKEIRTLLSAGVQGKVIAAKFDVGENSISRIKKGVTFGWLK